MFSALRSALPTGMQLTYCYECGFSSFVPCRDPDGRRETASVAFPLSQAAAPPTCSRCGSSFVQTTTNPSEFGDLYSQAVARTGSAGHASAPQTIATTASASPSRSSSMNGTTVFATTAPTTQSSPESPLAAAGVTTWNVLRSVFGTIQNSAPTIQQELRQALSEVWTGNWEAAGASLAASSSANELPPECQSFTSDDVLSTFEQYPHGLPRRPQGTTAASTSLCPICLEDCLASSDPPSAASATPYVVTLHCQHSFHRLCLLQWINGRHFTCPLCRQAMIYR